MPFKHLPSWIKTKNPLRNDVAPPGEGVIPSGEGVIPPKVGVVPQNGAVPTHKGQIGLLPLNPDDLSADAVPPADTYPVDIVAIHGITGDAFSTWTHKNGTNWLKDYLPTAFPGARIFTFGYSADVLWTRSTGNINTFARALLNGLVRERRQLKDPSRPIIFICHSMGGIVAKQAIVIARNDDVDYGDIQKSVIAILFLSTPHRGAGITSLLEFPLELVGLASYASLPVMSIVKKAAGKPRKDLVKALEKESKTLKEISTNFRNSRKNIKIASFVEQAIMPGLHKVIVDEHTGVMDIDEEFFVPMDGCDHTTVCRFENASSEGYKSILDALKKYAAQARENIKQLSSEDKSCLKSLAFLEMGYRRSDADKAHPKTCGWILQHESYKTWLEERGLLWIKGKPGAGKSTLLAFIYRNLRGTTSDQTNLSLEFFFHGRGTTLQKTSIGMFRSLLHQLYIADNSIRNPIRTAFHDKEVFGEVGRGWEWQLRELQDMFFNCIIAAAKFRKIVVFIDALDESGSDAKELVEYFHGLNDRLNESNSTAAICISCRHYPVTAVIPGLDVLVEENNHHDITYYVQAKLQTDTRKEKNGSQSNAWMEIEKQIVNNASGVFQWARLVVPMVIEQYEEGYSWDEIHQMLAKVPRELGDVYEHILNNIIKPERRKKTLHLMQWVFLAERPLTVDELRHAMAFDDIHISSLAHSYQDTERYIELYGGMHKLVNSLSGGLAEVKSYKHGNIVQFIHQSVNDFLLSTGLEFLVSKTSDFSHGQHPQEFTRASTNEILGRGHDRLSRSCVNYLRLALPEVKWQKVVPQIGAKQFSLPFIDYATIFWLVHAEKAEQYGVSQEHLSEQFEPSTHLLEKWIRIYTVIERNSRDRPETGLALLHIASGSNLRSTVQLLLKKGTSVEAQDDSGKTPLHYAAIRGHKDVVKMLLDVDAEPGSKSKQGVTPLEYAALNSHREIVELLLKGASDIDCALQAAASGGSIPILIFLLNSGADINASSGERHTALQAAAAAGHKGVVQFLLDKGANINLQSDKYASALQAAAEGGHESLFHHLLDKGADVHLQGGHLGNALQAAALTGSRAMIKELLNRGADVNIQGGHFGTALQAAVFSSHEDCSEVLLLLNNGANVNAPGGPYGSPLGAACYRENLNAVQLLIERGAEVNIEGGHYGNALQAAAYGGRISVIELLLERRADTNAQGGLYGTALQAAASQGKNEVVEFLIENGADIHIRGGLYETSLQAAASAGSGFMGGGTARLLLHHGADADINIQGGRWGNAIQAALHEGDIDIVKVLLAHGAIFDPQDEEFSKALLKANPLEVEELLSDRGYVIRRNPEYLMG